MAVSPITNIILELLSTGPEIALHITTDRMMQLVMYLQTVYETWWTPVGKHTYTSLDSAGHASEG